MCGIILNSFFMQFLRKIIILCWDQCLLSFHVQIITYKRCCFFKEISTINTEKRPLLRKVKIENIEKVTLTRTEQNLFFFFVFCCCPRCYLAMERLQKVAGLTKYFLKKTCYDKCSYHLDYIRIQVHTCTYTWCLWNMTERVRVQFSEA